MQRVTVVARLKAKVGLEDKVKQELLKLVEQTRKEVGCLNYDLHVDKEDPGTFLFYENWVSEMALDNHFHTPHFVRLQGLKGELFAEPSQISIMKMISEPE
jgi:quinol monooxygenase YgiN